MNAAQVSIAALILAASACTGARDLAGPTPITPPTPTAAPATMVTGHVTATNGGQPLGGLTAELGGLAVTTDGTGLFSVRSSQPQSALLNLTGGGIVPRSLTVPTTTMHDLHIDAFAAGFDLAFYRRFVRNAFDAPATLQPLRRLTAAPQVYLRTVDDAGQPIDSVTLDTTAAALRDLGSLLTGGALAVTSITRGTDSRAGQPGWLTVTWPGYDDPSFCGRTDVGLDGGVMQLNYLHDRCGCNGSRISPVTTKHELGHAFGFWHTGDAADLMSGIPKTMCDQMPSGREVQYARFAYARPIGNLDPDSDPAGAVSLAAMRVAR